MIKNLEELKEYNIICTNTDEVKECLDILEQLGFKIVETIYCEERIVKYNNNDYFYSSDTIETDYKDINFCNFKKQTKKFLKEKEKKAKEELPDFEVAEDGRIIKINNYKSNKIIYIVGNNDYQIYLFTNDFMQNNFIDLGRAFNSEKTKNKAIEKQKIYIKLKNLAERLNNGKKLNWNDIDEDKYYIYYDYANEELREEYNNLNQNQGTIYCLDENFLEIAKKEIGEENLLKLFED